MADASEGMLEAAKEKTAGIKNVAFEFALADACDLPFEDGQFDLVLAAHMLYHVSDLRAALSEIARVLKHDGRLCATTVSTQNLRELYKLCDQCGVVLPFPANGFTRDNGKPLLRDYFEKVELRDHESMLQVTEAEPLVAYVQSNDTFGKQSAEGIEQLRKEVRREDRPRGQFRHHQTLLHVHLLRSHHSGDGKRNGRIISKKTDFGSLNRSLFLFRWRI